MRPIIYQLFVRHFSNTQRGGVPHGDRSQNGCGTFAGINDAALESLRDMGVTHLWLTGVLAHATLSDYGGQQPSPSCLVKGKAGSPYAVRDYFDVDADLAENPQQRMEEFEALLARVRYWGMVPMIDFVPNHVSRDYDSPLHPEHNFGRLDDKGVFFSREQSFYYLQADGEGPPLRLPEGVYEGESQWGRVTGNNAASWTPSVYDWYETVKLNYGVDYRWGAAACDFLPTVLCTSFSVPQTWRTMDAILAFWQEKGVGGFRCDMAHMIPMRFWAWVSARCRLRDERCYLIAEAYDDHMKMTHEPVQQALLASGFNAVYDAPSYEALRHLYEKDGWANDLDKLHGLGAALADQGVRYLENHDEPRLCSYGHWANVGDVVTPALSVAQFASSRGPVLYYNGQELGERAEGAGGFGGDNGRTSIFDYTSLPRLQLWVNELRYDGGGLSAQQHAQRDWAGRLLRCMQQPAFAQGGFYGLNWANQQTVNFGRGRGETHSGHWLYAFLRYDKRTNDCYLALCNLSPLDDEPQLSVHIPRNAMEWCRRAGKETQRFVSVLDEGVYEVATADLEGKGLTLSLAAGQAKLLRWEN